MYNALHNYYKFILIFQIFSIPELVDNLSLSLYPPLDWEVSKKEAWILKDCLEVINSHLKRI